MTCQDADGHHFPPLPIEKNAQGHVRRVGVEVEFSGLSERRVATILQDTFGGELDDRDPHQLFVRGGALGDLEVELDTALGKTETGAETGGRLKDLLRGLVPVEIVAVPSSWTSHEPHSTCRPTGAVTST